MPDVAPPAHFSPEQRRDFVRACEHVQADELRRLTAEAVSIPSPVGAEAELAAYFTGLLAGGGLAAEYQEFGPGRGNAIARRAGDGSGPALLLYAPIDMHIAGNAEEDGPGLQLDGRTDLRPQAVIDGDVVIGLGAENPKGHAVCVAAAAMCMSIGA